VPLGPEAATAEQELQVLRGLEADGRSVRVLPPLLAEVLGAFERGEFDLFHLASHGAFGGEGLTRAAPLVVFNACRSGRVGYSLTRLGSWAGELIRLGCGGFVGTLWEVTDPGALAFAEAFYRHLFAGSLIGEAVRQARLVVRARLPGDPTWLAYCCFADPLAAVEAPAPTGALAL
jgi:hypothetical protein